MEITEKDNLTPETALLTPNLTPSVTPKKRIRLSLILIFLLATTIIPFLSYLVGFWPEIKMKNGFLPLPTPFINKPLNLLPSSLTTDSGFLKLEEDLKILQNENNNVDLSEPKISFPNLEMNVNFEK